MPKKRLVKQSVEEPTTINSEELRQGKRQRHGPGFYTSFVKGIVSRSGKHEDSTTENIVLVPEENQKKICGGHSEVSFLPSPASNIATDLYSSVSKLNSKSAEEAFTSVVQSTNIDSCSQISQESKRDCTIKQSKLKKQKQLKEHKQFRISSFSSSPRNRTNVVTSEKREKHTTKTPKILDPCGSICTISKIGKGHSCQKGAFIHQHETTKEDGELKHTGVQCSMSNLPADVLPSSNIVFSPEEIPSPVSKGIFVNKINTVLMAVQAEEDVNAAGDNDNSPVECHSDKTFQTVSATVGEDIMFIPGMQEFLLNKLPLQMKVLVQRFGKQVVITGSIDQVNCIWTKLSKRRKEHDAKKNKGSEEEEPFVMPEIALSGPEIAPSSPEEEVFYRMTDEEKTLQCCPPISQRVVVVEDDSGISHQVNVEVPTSQPDPTRSNNITSPQLNQNWMALPSDCMLTTNVNRKGDNKESHKTVFSVCEIPASSTEADILELAAKDAAGSTSDENSDLTQFSIADEVIPGQSENDTDFLISSENVGKSYVIGAEGCSELNSEESTAVGSVRIYSSGASSVAQREEIIDTSDSYANPVALLTDFAMISSSFGRFLPSPRTLQCGLCNAVCQNEELALEHMKSIHKNGVLNTCEVCDVTFPDKKGLLAHLKTKHEGSGISCQICGKKFQFHRYLRTHLQRHAGVKSFTCPVCGWRFFEQNKLKFHMETHKTAEERNLPFKCNLCNKQFVNKATYSDHCNTHSGLRPFHCHVCNAAFGHRVGLRRHLKTIHEKARPYACSYCLKEFTYKAKLDSHIILHTGISKHKCEVCGKVFTARTSLQRHHSKCSLGLKIPSSLLAKQETVPVSQTDIPENVNPVFLCGICCEPFDDYQEVEQHVILHDSRESSAPDEFLQHKHIKIMDSEGSPDFQQSPSSAQTKVQSGRAGAVCYIVSDVAGVESEHSGENSLLEHSNPGRRVEDGSCVQTSTLTCTQQSLNEEEQMQLAASTLADLSALC